MTTKRLFRSTSNRVFAGICGGLGEYFNVDPVAIRLVWLLVVIFTGLFPGVFAYILAIFIVPLKPYHHVHHMHSSEKQGERREGEDAVQ